MVIRITQQMKVNMMMQSTNGAMNGLFNVQKQILTGKKFTAPYENPYGASQVVKIKAQLGQLYDWQRNIDDAKDELKNTYDILTEMQENVQRINELAIRLANEAKTCCAACIVICMTRVLCCIQPCTASTVNRCCCWTAGSTPTTSTTSTCVPTTSAPGGTWSTGPTSKHDTPAP